VRYENKIVRNGFRLWTGEAAIEMSGWLADKIVVRSRPDDGLYDLRKFRFRDNLTVAELRTEGWFHLL
jgi:hypothetical protein